MDHTLGDFESIRGDLPSFNREASVLAQQEPIDADALALFDIIRRRRSELLISRDFRGYRTMESRLRLDAFRRPDFPHQIGRWRGHRWRGAPVPARICGPSIAAFYVQSVPLLLDSTGAGWH